MEIRTKAPYMAQDPGEVKELLDHLNASTRKNAKSGFLVKKKQYTIADGSGRIVNSWMLNDWDYKKPHLPCYARGLFSHENNGRPELAIRGYDKFFNVGEVNKTQWRNVEDNTRGPYELSVKENGCIIFIGGLDEHTLLVTSKHSTGARQDDSANHAFAGEAWLDKHLDAVGKTRDQLARKLREMNATAVAELCDDSFEEHVLEYKPEQAGLYLHGINLNLPEFATYPSTLVDQFAEDWGFRKTQYLVKDNTQDVKTFLDQCAETGSYAGRDTEGFVIRCQARDHVGGAWHDWFFKYKFEEPYLMYRQWREATKSIIAEKIPKIKNHKNITEEYLRYARKQLAKNPALGKDYNRNHGIIAMRDGFLHEKGMKGSDIIKAEQQNGNHDHDVQRDIVLVPIATIGCGKTTLSLALSRLFGWGHEQNDNIQGKGSRPQRFALAVNNALFKHLVVIADRNNHQRREREQIIEDVSKSVPDSRFVALHYVHDRSDYEAIRQTLQARVLNRGDNHQTIQAGSKSSDEIIGIMDGFMRRFEPVDPDNRPDNKFDLIIDLDVQADSRANLETVVTAMHEEYPNLFTMPTAAQMNEAIEAALSNYKPDIKHDLGNKSQKPKNTGNKPRKDVVDGGGQQASAHANGNASLAKSSTEPKIEYFGAILPSQLINVALEDVFRGRTAETTRFFTQLKISRRIQSEFHVTLIHKTTASSHREYWQTLENLWKSRLTSSKPEDSENTTLGAVLVTLKRIIWDDRVMCIEVELANAASEEQKSGVKFTSANEVAHITIGTASNAIKPRESNDLLSRWKNGNVAGKVKIKELNFKNDIVLEGSVRAVPSRF